MAYSPDWYARAQARDHAARPFLVESYRPPTGRFIPEGRHHSLTLATASARWFAQCWTAARVVDESGAVLVELRCDATDADECSMVRERLTAGRSDDIPDCPVHGPYRGE